MLKTREKNWAELNIRVERWSDCTGKSNQMTLWNNVCSMIHSKNAYEDFADGPVVRTQHFYCWGAPLDDPKSHAAQPKINKNIHMYLVCTFA